MFSQIIDTIVTRTNRVDMTDMIVDITNGIVRRIQSKQYFLSDLVELDIPVEDMEMVSLGSDDELFGVYKYIWNRKPDCRLINSVQFLPSGKCPPNNQPSVGQNSIREYWYKVGNKYVFICDSATTSVRVSYYKTSSEMIYQDSATRTLTYDWTENKWSEQQTASGVTSWVELTDDEALVREDELAKYGNWLLRDYKEVVISGAISKVYSTLNDSERFRYEFAEFNDLFQTLTNNERYANFAY